MKLIDETFITCVSGCICVTLSQDETMGYYMAHICTVSGNDSGKDVEYTQDWGQKLTKEQAVGFFPDKADDIHMNYKS